MDDLRGIDGPPSPADRAGEVARIGDRNRRPDAETKRKRRRDAGDDHETDARTQEDTFEASENLRERQSGPGGEAEDDDPPAAEATDPSAEGAEGTEDEAKEQAERRSDDEPGQIVDLKA